MSVIRKLLDTTTEDESPETLMDVILELAEIQGIEITETERAKVAFEVRRRKCL